MEATSEKKLTLTVDNWVQASERLKMRLRKLGDAGKEIRSGVREQVAPVTVDQRVVQSNDQGTLFQKVKIGSTGKVKLLEKEMFHNLDICRCKVV